MKIDRMKFIDQYIGRCICLGLDTYEYFHHLFVSTHAGPVKTAKRIVICKYFGIGSIIMAEPLCSALRRHYPDASIEILTFDTNREFCKIAGLFDNIITIRTNNMVSFAFDALKALRNLRRSKVDVIFDLEFFSKFSTLISYLSNSKNCVGFYLRSIYRGNLLTHHVYYNHYKHISRIFLAFAEAIGVGIEEPIKPPTLQVTDRIRACAPQVLKKFDIPAEAFSLVMNPNASELSFERRWPPENFVAIVNKILEEFSRVHVVLIGVDKDAAYVSKLFDGIHEKKRAHNTAGRTSAEELFALIQHSSLFVGNDSGPLHIATALKKPTVSFYGPETSSLYGPIGREHKVFYGEIYCSPCMSVYNVKTANCSQNPTPCMKAIHKDAVWEQVRMLIQNLHIAGGNA